jgi:hypothetical protein
MESRIPPSSKINCEIHTDVLIDYFCSQHDVVCCRACLSDSHKSCESVLPLDSASKDVRNSSLLSDTLEEQEYMTETLQKIEENRDENKKLLKLTFLISLNSMSISLIADDMSRIFLSVFWMIVICFRKVKNT